MRQHDHCRDCPFRNGIPAEIIENPSGDSPLVLCHESLSLDGRLTLDMECAGNDVCGFSPEA